jgi:hypothetical protein
MARWKLEALQLAADVRVSSTDYTDDQVWELLPGTGDNPALTLQTQYGGRVGLATLVPMWLHNGQTIYQAQTYARPPTITAFAPGYAMVEGALTADLPFSAEYRALESHAVGGCFTVRNSGIRDETVRLEVFGHLIARDREQTLAILTLVDGTHALSMGKLPGLEAVVVLADAHVELVPGRKASPKIGIDLALASGEEATVRWVHAGLDKAETSLERAQWWLAQDWQIAVSMPEVKTGDDDLDKSVALSYHQLIQSFIGPGSRLPGHSFVASRNPAHGYSRAGDGSDYGRGWNGQTPHLAYLAGLGIAPVAPELAKDIVRNYLAVQSQDGWIDFAPGMGGQRQDMLCPPLLARLAWGIYEYTEDRDFLREVMPGLLDFFNRWCELDLDADGDVLPEWQNERQTGYVFWPTFGTGQPWAQNTHIGHVETPDLGAYLISEALSLQKMAAVLDDPGAYELQNRAREFMTILDRLWFENRFAYRDRDTDMITIGVAVVENGRGDEDHLPALKLETPSRLLVRISGGMGKAPRAKLTLEGFGVDGQPLTETVNLSDFTWSYGHGVYTSDYVYSQIDRVRCEGLIRVYHVTVRSVDLTRLDVNALLPLWTGDLPAEKAKALVTLAGDESRFLRPTGLSIVSAKDPDFDPSSANGGGGVWGYFTTLVGEGLIDAGAGTLAAEVARRLLRAQASVVDEQQHFTEFYHTETQSGLGERGHLAGIVPLHLLMRLFGIRIVNSRTVWTGGPLHWGRDVSVTQYGVQIWRSTNGTTIRFPSGHEVQLEADDEWQRVVDPEGVSDQPDRMMIEIDENTAE